MCTKYVALLPLALALRAAPVDDALAAAQALSAAPNYAWTATIDQNGHAAEIRGKTSDSRYSTLTFVGFIGSRTPRASPTGPDTTTTTNAVFLGNDRGVIETASGWVPPTEPAVVADQPEPATNGRASSRSGSRGGAGGPRSGRGGTGRVGGGGMGRGGGMGGQRGRTGGSSEAAPAASAPRIPTAINLPADELAIMATNHSEVRFADGILTGKLTSTGADLLFVAPGSTKLPPAGSGGTFKIWVKDGAVTQYELKLTADSQPDGGRGSFAETITVTLKDVGSTKFDVPAAAKKKLGI